jgi:hypothetical protein
MVDSESSAHAQTDPEVLIREYLRARFQWEHDAVARSERAQADGTLKQTLAQTQSEYEEIVRAFCAPDVLRWVGNKAFGSPPDVNPAATRIDAPLRSRRGWIVTTHESVDPFVGEQTYVYDIEQLDDRLVLTDRSTQDLDGRWIRRLL